MTEGDAEGDLDDGNELIGEAEEGDELIEALIGEALLGIGL